MRYLIFGERDFWAVDIEIGSNFLRRLKNLSRIAVTIGDTNGLQVNLRAEPEQNTAEQIVDVAVVVMNNSFRHVTSLLPRPGSFIRQVKRPVMSLLEDAKLHAGFFACHGLGIPTGNPDQLYIYFFGPGQLLNWQWPVPESPEQPGSRGW